MAEYIEREKAIQFVNQNICHFNGETTLSCVEICLKAAPAADVVEVVRCKDCEYRGWVQEPCHGKSVHYCKIHDNCITENDFCSYGKRKEAGE